MIRGDLRKIYLGAILLIVAVGICCSSDHSALNLLGYLFLILLPQGLLIIFSYRRTKADFQEVCHERIDEIAKNCFAVELADESAGRITYRPFVLKTILLTLGKGINACHASPVAFSGESHESAIYV